MADKRTEVILAYKTDTASVAKVIAETKAMAGKLSESVPTGGLSGKKSEVLGRETARELAIADTELGRIADNQRKRLIEEAKLMELSATRLEERTRALQTEQRANQEAINTLRQSGDISDKTAKKIQKYEQANEELGKTLNFIATNALPKANASLAQTGKVALSAQESYDEVNRNVALAGDVASNAAQVGGALRAIGADFAGDALEGAVILGDLTEGLPRLKEAAKGLPSIIGNVVATLGPVGIGLGAVALGAVVAFGELSKEIDKARNAGKAYADAIAEAGRSTADVTQLLAQGDIEGALTQLKGLNEQRLNLILRQQEAESALAEAQAQKDLFFDDRFGVFNSIAEALSPTMAQVNATFNQATVNATALNDEMLAVALSQQATTEALLSYGFSIEEIEAGIAELTATTDTATEAINELNASLLEQANATRNRYLEEINLLGQTEDALLDRQTQLNNEIEANRLAIDVLRQSGDTSEQVAEQIAKYEQANMELGKTLEFIGNTALPQANARARAEQARADTEQTREDTIEATRRYNDTIANLNESAYKELLGIEQKRTDSLLAIAKKYADDTEQALTRLNADLTANTARYTQNEIQARTQALSAELDATRAHYDSLSDISTQSKRDEQDAIRNLDFKSAFEARRNRNRAIEDEQKKFARDARDREINQDRERKERLSAYEQSQRDAQSAYQKELQSARENRDRALSEARSAYQRELSEARNAQAQKLATEQAGYAQELALARQTSAQRLAIQAQTDAQLLAQAQALLTALARRPATPFFGSSPSSPRPSTPTPIAPRRGGTTPKGGNTPSLVVNIQDSRNPRKTAGLIKGMVNSNSGNIR